jgi:hypothetical protein
MRPQDYMEGVELIVTPGVGIGQVNFPDIPELRSDSEKDIIIRSLEVYPAEVLPLTFSGNPVATTAQVQNAFLTLYIYGENKVYRVPLIKFVNVYAGGTNAGSLFWTDELNQLENYKVDWTKSSLNFPSPITVEANLSFFFNVSYMKLPPGTLKKNRALKAASINLGVVPN